MPINIPNHRLQNQHLLTPTLKDPVEVLKSLVAIQAQDYYGAKWALGQRTVSCTDPVVEEAFTDGRILRLHVMRPTWHFVTADDIRWLVRLTAPRVNTVSSHYYRKAELDNDTFKRTNKALIKALKGGRQLTRADLREAIKREGIQPGDSMRFGYIMHRSELDGVVCSGARRGKQFTYALLDERVPRFRELDNDEALGELTARYFTTRGPATVQDYAWWSGLTTVQAKRGLEIVGKQLRTAVIDGKSFSLAGKAGLPSVKPIRACLLPAYDEYFISYKDRTAGIHRDFDQKTMATKLVFDAPLVIDGQAVGGWSRVIGQTVVTVHVRPFIRLTRPARSAVTRAAESYASFLERDLHLEWVN
jgi:Winged helix DNA-binding domain